MTFDYRQPQARKDRLPALDGLRGIAAMCIAIFHNQPFFGRTIGFFDWGWINMDLFFLISGVVMMHVYERDIATQKMSFSDFLSHRIARLWPLHVFAMGTIFLADMLFNFLEPGHHFVQWSSAIYTFLLNLVLLQNVGLYYRSDTEGASWDGNAWSLTPEIILNLLWVFLILRRKLSSTILIAAILICAILQYNIGHAINTWILGSGLIRCTISYGIGCLLYRHFINNPALGRPSFLFGNMASCLVIFLLLIVILNGCLWQSPLLADWDWICVLFLFPAVTYFSLQTNTILNKLLASRFFTFLGAISYSVYLMHVQIAFLLVVFDSVVLHGAIKPPYLGILFLGIVIGVATLTLRFVETPARKYLRVRLPLFIDKICLRGVNPEPAVPKKN
jgi:peptidoglycan/LPS O-acetylase OafA/YrhL